MMLSQLNEQQVAELAEKSNAETMKKFNARPGTAEQSIPARPVPFLQT